MAFRSGANPGDRKLRRSGASASLIDRGGLDALIGALAAQGYRVVGPTVRDRAIVYDDIAGVADLPQG